jgi:hypothetical protein
LLYLLEAAMLLVECSQVLDSQMNHLQPLVVGG